MIKFQLATKNFTSWLTILIGLITVAFSFFYIFARNSIQRDQTEMELYRIEKQRMVLDSIQEKLNSMRQEIASSQDSIVIKKSPIIDSIFKNDKNYSQLKQYFEKRLNKINSDVQTLKVNSKIDSLDNRLKALEDALMENPSKALALPLLQKELENQKETETKDIATIKTEISTIYDQNKWFIGLMFTLAIGMISLAVTNFLPKKEKTSTRDDVKKD